MGQKLLKRAAGEFKIKIIMPVDDYCNENFTR